MATSSFSSMSFHLPTSANERPHLEAGQRKRASVALRPLLLCFCLFPLSFLLGCAPRGLEPARLTLISPHRDEIREEVEIGFRDWFHARSLARATTAHSALQTWLAGSDAQRTQPVKQALDELFQDWQPADLDPLPQAARQWQEQPGARSGGALLAALERWQEQVPPVELVWQDIGGGTSQIARYVTARFESTPAGIGLDVVFGGGTDIFLRFANQGLLEKLELPAELFRGRIPPELNGIPLYDAAGRWYGPILSSFGILQNREVLKRIHQEPPRRWSDLGQPGLCGWVSSGDPRMTGSIHMVYEIILQSYGWEEGFRLLMRQGANTHTFIRDSGTLSRTVASGEVAVAGSLDGFALTATARDPERIAFQLPERETIINPDAIAVLKGAPHRELARAFVEYTMSDACQLLFLLKPGQPGGPRRHALARLSVVAGLYGQYPANVRSVGAANPFQAGNTIRYDSKLATGRWDALNDVYGAAIMDAHAELTAAWRAVLALADERRPGLEQELFAQFCTHEELMAHARSIVEESPRVRTATVNGWGERARQRYRHILNTARRS
jgi:ABC-type Fe3+ transport system substrate-binding protein